MIIKKKILFAVLVLLLVGWVWLEFFYEIPQHGLGAATVEEVTKLEQDIGTLQGDYFKDHGDYQPILGDMKGIVGAEVHSYRGPDGPGYVVFTERTEADGSVWKKAKNVGPEKWREQDWIQTKPAATSTP